MHRLSRVAWDMNPNSTFHHAASGREISFKEYFLEQYNIVMEDDNQPLIVSFEVNEEGTTVMQVSEGKPKQPGEDPQVTYLVPELCQETGLTDSMRKDTRTMKV